MIFNFHYQIRLLQNRWWHQFICTQQIFRRCDSFVRFVPSQIPGVNRMSINSTKSKIVFTTSKGNRSRVENVQPQIHLIDSLIETCSSAELLGVTVSTSLSWSSINVIHICISCHESKYTFELITEKCFITQIFLHISTIIVSYGGNVQVRKRIKMCRAAIIILDCDFVCAFPRHIFWT